MFRHTDTEGNVYVLIPGPKLKKGDPSCRGCVVREVSAVPGGSFCRQFEYKCQIPFNKHVWRQVKWGAYSDVPERAPTEP